MPHGCVIPRGCPSLYLLYPQDPQQRLLLECSAETIFGQLHEGLAPRVAAGAKCGVYIGASSVDYMKLCMAYNRSVSAYSATGRAS